MSRFIRLEQDVPGGMKYATAEVADNGKMVIVTESRKGGRSKRREIPSEDVDKAFDAQVARLVALGYTLSTTADGPKDMLYLQAKIADLTPDANIMVAFGLPPETRSWKVNGVPIVVARGVGDPTDPKTLTATTAKSRGVLPVAFLLLVAHGLTIVDGTGSLIDPKSFLDKHVEEIRKLPNRSGVMDLLYNRGLALKPLKLSDFKGAFNGKHNAFVQAM